MLSRKLMTMCVLFLVGFFCMSPMAWGENLINLSLKKKARQSSTNGGDAQRAVDGNRDGNYSANSVTHTGNSPGEWWEVDLGSVQQIKDITIWNRTDCCGERLADFSVLVSERPFSSNSLDNLHTLLGDSSVWSYRNEGVAGAQTQVPVDAAGRYVRIQMAGANYLSLAEVEVMGESRGGNSGGYGGGSKVSATPAVSKNLALKKKARQSSTGYGGDAQRAVDGNKDGNYAANSITHTNNSPGEWWEVDLGSVQQIKEIIVWNRTDCCSERLADFSVLVSERPFSSNSLDSLLDDSSVWSYRNEGAAGKQTQVPVDVSGRYVRIQMAGANYLSLAEVEVLGESRGGNSGGYGGGSKASTTPAASKNLALKKKARQSSNTGGEAQRAVDGNRDGNYFANSVTHTGNSPGEWWEVDLGSVRQIKEITLWNRTDCCGERLADFSVLVSERPFSSNSLDNILGDSSVWSYRNDGVASKQTQVPVDVSGRYVRVQLSGANYLSLAEVEVMGQ